MPLNVTVYCLIIALLTYYCLREYYCLISDIGDGDRIDSFYILNNIYQLQSEGDNVLGSIRSTICLSPSNG